MATRQKKEDETKAAKEFDGGGDFAEEGGDFGADFNIEGDFNAEEEFKPTPLIPRGSYTANVTDVKFSSEDQCIIWTVTLDGNGGYMSDDETPIDGATISYKNWLPKLGDENELTKSGRMTKRQAKINMLKQFGDEMNIDVSTPKAIVTALQNGDWIGLGVRITVGMREFEGRTFNDVSKMVAG